MNKNGGNSFRLQDMRRSYYASRPLAFFSEFSGAFADLGTFLPLVVAVLSVGGFDATGVMVGFGLFAIATGLYYRRPVPIQPMKAVAAVIIVGQLSAGEAMATGILLGAMLIGLGSFGLIGKLQKLIPLSVLLGVQLGLGLQLSYAAFSMAGEMIWPALLLLGLLCVLTQVRFGHFGLLVLVIGAVCWSIMFSRVDVPAFAGLHFPSIGFPALNDFAGAFKVSFLPQLVLTISNAILLTALVAGDYYPKDKSRISPRNLCFTTGFFNLLLAPLGAIPMCHGAGGVAAHYKYGARGALAPVLFGVMCLMIAIFAGADAKAWLSLLPLVLVAAMLCFAGIQLINVSKLKTVRSDCYPVIAVVAGLGLFVDISLGLIAGLLLELGRGYVKANYSGSKTAR